ncbi:unnamed protein product [Cylicocyclus nassatus]|uniref:C2H2-type domain-containing protein n=1 Tax=Cylicocyclus nassatus TaxID=53992 RepID=A0AA36MBM7_CYLNA|nr:unnamed protein product [Cylicocyclus nassatus]
MKGRVHGTDVCELANCLTYVQVNIYNTDILTLKEHGFDIEDWLRDTGYRSIIMDVPVLNSLNESAGEIVARRRHDAEKKLQRGKMVVHTPDLHDDLLTPKSSSKPPNTLRHALAKGNGEISEDETLYEDCKLLSGEEPHIDTAITTGETTSMGCAKDRHSNSTFHHSFPTLERPTITRNNGVDEEMSGLVSATAGHRADDLMSDDTSYVITELSPPIAPLNIKSSETIEENNTASNIAAISPSESRSINADSSIVHDTGNEAEMSPKVNAPARKGRWKNHQLSPFVRTFECHYPACTTKIIWRPGYGKNRLVTHVRIHWGKKLKKCRHCDYSATHWGGIYQHHQRKHPDEEFAGAIDLETEQDMRELMELWRQCYPGAVEEEFCDPKLARITRASRFLHSCHNV